VDRIKPIDLSKIKTSSIKKRRSKVRVSDFAKPLSKNDFKEFIDSLPNILETKDIKEIAKILVSAKKKERIIIWGLGAHVIKVGLSPIIIDLIKSGYVSCVCLNGAGIIHDTEIAIYGKTSEDVERGLAKGEFGMAKETAAFLNDAIKDGIKDGLGIGESVGRALVKNSPRFVSLSIVASAIKNTIPVTVHVAIGTDIIHMHPSFDASSTGEGSHRDFRLLCSIITKMQKGVYMNVGSAVILPEVFLKALNIARNLGFSLDNITTVNMDFISHYRAITNVVKRPTQKGGKGYNLVGHHEIMIPLLSGIIKVMEGLI